MTRCSSLSGSRNNVSGDAGNDWIGIGGGDVSTTSVLDGGDGDDFIGATANSNWLVGGTGNDMLQAVGASNALVGGDGNDQLQANGNSNTLDGGTGNDSLFVAGGFQSTISLPASATTGSAQTATFISCTAATGSDWIGATGDVCALYGGSGDDTLLGVGNNHRLFGGDGNDWVGVSGNQ